MGQIRGQGAKALVELSECFAEQQERSGLQHQGIILTGRALQEEAELVVFVCFIPLLAVRKADKFLQESLPVGTCYHSGDPYILVHSGLSDFWNCLVVQQSHRDCNAVQGSAHLQLSHSLLQVFSGIPGQSVADCRAYSVEWRDAADCRPYSEGQQDAAQIACDSHGEVYIWLGAHMHGVLGCTNGQLGDGVLQTSTHDTVAGLVLFHLFFLTPDCRAGREPKAFEQHSR